MDASEIAKAQHRYETERWRYTAFAEATRSLVTQLVEAAGVAVDSVTCRAKESTTLAGKLARKPKYKSLDDVPDLVGIRVVTRYKSDVEVVSRLLEQEFDVIELVIHGAHDADAFGYLSRHLVVRLSEPRASLPEWTLASNLHAEIQVRSILQHSWASISHGLDYKTDEAVPQEVRRQLFRVAALLETGDELFDDFRARVESLQSTYRADVARDDWRNLPVNLDSLVAAIDRLPLSELEQAAVESTWQPNGTPDVRVDSSSARDILISRLVTVAVAAGYKTVGAIADLMLECIGDRNWLKRLAEAGDERDYRPWALPTDVALLRLISKNISDEVLAAAHHTTIATPLVDAAVHVPTNLVEDNQAARPAAKRGHAARGRAKPGA